MFSLITATTAESTTGKVHHRRHPVLWSILVILFLIIVIVGYFVARAIWLPPKDLGIRYTDADFNSAMEKIGIQITANLDLNDAHLPAALSIALNSRPTLSLSLISGQSTPDELYIDDYEWTFTDYQARTFSLTEAEATAFFNEIAPHFWWFKDSQIAIRDGKILTSSIALVKKMKIDLFSDIAGEIPFPLPDKVNLYTEGTFSITNNDIAIAPDVVTFGSFSLPAQYKTAENMAIAADYLERFFKVIPDLQINFAGVKDGAIYFDGVIPTKVEINPK